MKKYVCYIVLIVMIILVVNIIIKNNSNGSDKVVTAFESGNYANSRARVESFFYYGDVYLDEENKKELLDKIVRGLGITSDYEYEATTLDGDRLSRVDYAFKGGSLCVELITQENQISSNVYSLNHFITVIMEFNNSMDSAWYYKNKLEDVLETLPFMSIRPEVSISMQGELQGDISPVAKKKMCKEIFSQLDAKIVLDYWNESSTMYGYSENINEYKSIGGKKVNINVAFGYDEEKKVTNIYVATPIYNGDF